MSGLVGGCVESLQSKRRVAPMCSTSDSIRSQVPSIPVPEFATQASLSPAVTSLHHSLGVPTPIDRPEVARVFQWAGETPHHRHRYARLRRKTCRQPEAPVTARARLQTLRQPSSSCEKLIAAPRDQSSAFQRGAGLRRSRDRFQRTRRPSALKANGTTHGGGVGRDTTVNEAVEEKKLSSTKRIPAAWLVDGISRSRNETAALFELLKQGELDVSKFHPQPPHRPPSPRVKMTPSSSTLLGRSARTTRSPRSTRSLPSTRSPHSPVQTSFAPTHSHDRPTCFHRKGGCRCHRQRHGESRTNSN